MNSRMLLLNMTTRRVARVVAACGSLLLVGQLASGQTCSPRGLVGWWPGEGNALDVTGSHDGTLVGGVTFAPGIVGTAFKFDGTNSVQVPDSPSLNPTNAITVEAWIKPGQNGPIVKKNGNDQSGYALEQGGNQMCFGVFVRGRGWTGGCAGMSPGQWTHIAGVYDGQNAMLYINGVMAASSSIVGTIEPANGSPGSPRSIRNSTSFRSPTRVYWENTIGRCRRRASGSIPAGGLCT